MNILRKIIRSTKLLERSFAVVQPQHRVVDEEMRTRRRERAHAYLTAKSSDLASIIRCLPCKTTTCPNPGRFSSSSSSLGVTSKEERAWSRARTAAYVERKRGRSRMGPTDAASETSLHMTKFCPQESLRNILKRQEPSKGCALIAKSPRSSC